MNTGIESYYSQFQILTSRNFESRLPQATKSVKDIGRLNNLKRVYSRNKDLTTKTRKSYQKNTRANFYKMTAIPYKHSKKGGTNKSFKETIAILRISNLQQSLILRIGTADITLNTRPDESKTNGRESVDNLGRNKFKGWKGDKESFDSN